MKLSDGDGVGPQRSASSVDDSVGDLGHVDQTIRGLLAEATEVAWGRRHLSVVHGDPSDVATSRHLSAFYEELRRLAAGCEWIRVRGNAEYVTVTVDGALAEEQIALFEAAAAFANPGDWTIVASAVPPLS